MSFGVLADILDVLAVEAPEDVARGRATLTQVLQWTETSRWREVAWSFSDLAGGSPLELVWRPGRPGLFWTAEPAPPEWLTPRRFRRALALAATLGARFSADKVTQLRDAVEQTSAPWPIWLSGRHDATGDTAKIYALTDNVVLPMLRGDDRIVMLGLSADGGREYYWRRPSRQAGDHWRLAQEPSLRPLAAQLNTALLEWTDHGLDAEHAGRIGLSLKLSPSGKPEALAAFLRVHQAGGEDAIRRKLLAHGGEVNPAIATLWAAGRLSPMFLTLAATEHALMPAMGFQLVK